MNYPPKRFKSSSPSSFPHWLRCVALGTTESAWSHSHLLGCQTAKRTELQASAPFPMGVILALWVVPGSPHNRIVGTFQQALSCQIAAPAQSKQINPLLLQLLAKTLRVPLAYMSILTGDTGRKKQVQIGGIAPQRVWLLLKPYAQHHAVFHG